MKIGTAIRVAMALLPLVATGDELDTIENGGITSEQRAYLESLSCRAWNDTSVDTFRTRETGRGWITVSLECRTHGTFRGRRLRQTGVCEAPGGRWECTRTGIEIELGDGTSSRPVRLIDVEPEKALELLSFLEVEARRGKRIRPGLLEAPMSLSLESRGRYLATAEFTDVATSVEILAKCGRRGCRYRLGHIESWQNF